MPDIFPLPQFLNNNRNKSIMLYFCKSVHIFFGRKNGPNKPTKSKIFNLQNDFPPTLKKKKRQNFFH